MPAEYTHQIIAENVLEALPAAQRERVSDFSAYCIGAQGGDVFYFLRIFCTARYNLGKFLHNCRVYDVFSEFLSAAAGAGPAGLSYIVGYITHYAADTVFHPFVYGMTAQLCAQYPRVRCRWHSYIESDLDTYFVEKSKGIPVGAYRFPVDRRTADAEQIAPVLDRVCRAVGQKRISPRLFRRALRRYEWFERAFYDKHGRRRRFFTGMERLLHIPRFCSTLCRRQQIDARSINADGAVWRNPSQPSLASAEGADALFDRSVRESVRLIGLFFACLDGGTQLPREDFDKGFLSGVDCSLPVVRPHAGDGQMADGPGPA